ncbi:MAG: Fe-S protein assembly co-chaperone HscB [gamma proteobacterium symbiont of Bathyaustriella thionipta]|nr:Fe-S protein assembly co-chaperone HscB [gamma proteobacterium symbiont of Bathyaustriella thionipta]MCU7949079.1 Fe-S protein assembly co-chaperone HscB [gamma proteobacterium symbiont of Bathyaustriella thionipta]MCU7952773.1 Fe-S protein assembly co-chaperone HscB [gamma proteobacterium symbiont of Bathyaustriella thionipta]MCU7955730.1 Fe-S protein assembly co-chaperone HscB [gamma proteobacterium symbiont of Bathyaustriella thionipta]MCU7967798.1 Fe-S protein assembly co-chaperone HscB 
MTNSIKNNHTENFFSLLGLPVSFSVDKKSLTENYHDIQKSIHPDKFANASDLERRLSVQKAAQINDALETLKNPTQRSIYLLSLYGIELGENNNSVDPAFLMEQMELRENLSQVSDKADPLDALDTILEDVKSRINQTINSLETLFQQLLSDDEKNEDELLKKLTPQVLKMQFLNRLQEECMNKEEDLADQI